MAEIPRVLPPIEIEDGKLLPTYFEELQEDLLSQDIDRYTKFQFENRLCDLTKILFSETEKKSITL